MSVTAPTTGARWTSGTTQSIAWTSTAVSAGAFDAYLINTITGVWYLAGSTTAVPSQTSYSRSFSTIGIPLGAYTAYVSYRTNAAVWANWVAAVQSAPGAVTLQ